MNTAISPATAATTACDMQENLEVVSGNASSNQANQSPHSHRTLGCCTEPRTPLRALRPSNSLNSVPGSLKLGVQDEQSARMRLLEQLFSASARQETQAVVHNELGSLECELDGLRLDK